MQDFFVFFISFLEILLNVLEFIAIITSIITFFFLMLNQYSKSLKIILSPCGLGFWQRVKILFICRKSQIKKRAFIEYAILKTGGCPVIYSEWNTIINGFKTYYVDSEQNSLKYTISNCTPLIEKEFSEVVAKYFKYFSQEKVKKAFGIQEETFSWVITLHIEEAYATPTCLLTGLLSQYNESWEEFIKRYVSTAYISDNSQKSSTDVLSNELYFTFAWLLWGPSYEIEFHKYWAGLCQLSYGDESNSIPAIADIETNVANLLKKKFIENEKHRYGALIAVDVSLFDKKPFYSSLRDDINPNNAYFYDKVENGDLSFGIKINNFSSSVNYKAKKYYSTAYVWVLFELEDEDFSFKPEKSVAFFEHANLADKTTYSFLIETLIEKSLKHFETIFSSLENAKRKYRFVCAMNDQIALKCLNAYREIMESGSSFGNILKNNVILESKHCPSDVFSSYDEFFTPSKKIDFVEVSYLNQNTISSLGQFYTNIYRESFPDENERETFDNILKYLKNSPSATEYKYHIILAKDETNKIIGGCIFNYFKKSNTGVIEFLAIRSDLQSSGLGSLLYKHVKSILSETLIK